MKVRRRFLGALLVVHTKLAGAARMRGARAGRAARRARRRGRRSAGEAVGVWCLGATRAMLAIGRDRVSVSRLCDERYIFGVADKPEVLKTL